MDKILYFPYVNVPQDRWTIKSLLYWDEISTISPDQVVSNWKTSDSISGILYRNGAINPINPGKYLDDSDLFSNTVFLLKELELGEYRNRLDSSHESNFVYSEKWPQEVFELLASEGLARKTGGDYIVETRIANTIMLYLAYVIASHKNLMPSTDIATFANSKNLASDTSQKLRFEFLNRLIPCPTNPNIEKLIFFRERYSQELRLFRKELELEINAISKFDSTEEAMDYAVGFRSKQIEKETARIKEIIQNELDDKSSKTALDVLFAIFGAVLSKGGTLIPKIVHKGLDYLRPERKKLTVKDLPNYYLVLLEQEKFKI